MYTNITFMGREEIIAKVKSQNFANGTYVVFGSGPLAAADIRQTQDIDLVVSENLYRELHYQGWRFKSGIDGSSMLTNGDFAVSRSWKFGEYNPRLEDLLASSDNIDGVSFVNLHEVRAWKKEYARPKDLQDIELIDHYMGTQGRV